MEIKVPVNEEMMKEKEVLVASLKKDDTVKSFLVSNELDERFVEQFPYRIQKGLTNMKKCAGCNGLHECRQPNKGQFNALSYDGMLILQPKLCAYASAHQSERAHLKKFWINQMPEHLKTVSIKQIDQSKESADYLRAFAEVTLNLTQPEQGLYLCGAVGTGKTYLACCIANYFARKGQSVVFVQTPGWISKMKGMFNDPDGFERELEMMKKANVVILDDIGAESVTPWVRDELLFPILNERMENGRLTYFTSNEELSSLQDHYAYSSMGEEKMKAVRLMERIKMLSKPVEIQGKNRRFNK
ncbi:MAG: ATP-binding protein [Erysipelotrichaceae bacterium]|nr:ATP-binding protein [Erysipelotrichaceae bacterium]